MNREELEQRIAAINNEMTLTKANYAKLEGHLAEAQHWLNGLNNNECEETFDQMPCTEPVAEDAECATVEPIEHE